MAKGDVTDAPSLREAAAGCSLVYHLAGAYRGSPDELRATHVGGTSNLLVTLAPGTRLVYLSSTSVYGWDRLWPAGPDTPPRPASAYGEAKLAAEELVRRWDAGSAVVVRPTITYGVGDDRGMLARVVRLLHRGVRRLPGTGANRIHLLHVDDLVAALVTLGAKGDGVFVVGGPEAAPARRIFGLLARGAGLPAPAFGLPVPVLRPLAAGVERAWNAAGLEGEAPLNRHSVDVATRDRAYDWSRAAADLLAASDGWFPRNPPRPPAPEQRASVAFAEQRAALHAAWDQARAASRLLGSLFGDPIHAAGVTTAPGAAPPARGGCARAGGGRRYRPARPRPCAACWPARRRGGRWPAARAPQTACAPARRPGPAGPRSARRRCR